jgi:tetratricopeptide (TPR) repeat protein
LAKQLLGDYEDFASSCPENDMAPIFLDRAANIARGLKDYERGLKNYQAIVDRYPNFDRIIETKFLIAFMYDNEIKDKSKAEEHYKAVAEEYPTHVFGKNAKDRLVTLHMSDKELLEFFEEKNKKN